MQLSKKQMRTIEQVVRQIEEHFTGIVMRESYFGPEDAIYCRLWIDYEYLYRIEKGAMDGLALDTQYGYRLSDWHLEWDTRKSSVVLVINMKRVGK